MRAANITAVVIGILSSIFCFLGLAAEALPYQDPTPAMLARQAQSIGWWQFGTLVSVVLTIAGLFGLWRDRTRRRASQSADLSAP
jgi:hypothetical protein